MGSWGWTGDGGARILTGTLDAELEEYRLLAYLQRVDALYKELKLYPCLEELGSRIAELQALCEQAKAWTANLAGDITGIDLQRGKLERSPVVEPVWDAVLQSLERALPPLVQAMERGGGLREELHRTIRFEPVGVVPLDAREGWLMLRQRNEAWVYSYALPIVRQARPVDPYRIVHTRFHGIWTVGLATTYGQIKTELVRCGPLPNPATFVFETDLSLPRIETFLPLAKRITYELVASAD
jgi:hypothetical protein